MERILAVLAVVAVGGLIAVQAPLNAGLGRATGDIAAAVISFVSGTVALAVILVVSGRVGGLANGLEVPWYYLLGGLLGAIYVFTTLLLVRSIGAGGVAAAIVTGQLIVSILLDRLGAFGLEVEPLDGQRLAGVVLLLGGTFFVVR